MGFRTLARETNMSGRAVTVEYLRSRKLCIRRPRIIALVMARLQWFPRYLTIKDSDIGPVGSGVGSSFASVSSMLRCMGRLSGIGGIGGVLQFLPCLNT